VPGKLATTFTEDGQQMEYRNKHYNVDQNDETHRKTEEEMEGPTSS
jgi:hypothetical protein